MEEPGEHARNVENIMTTGEHEENQRIWKPRDWGFITETEMNEIFYFVLMIDLIIFHYVSKTGGRGNTLTSQLQGLCRSSFCL